MEFTVPVRVERRLPVPVEEAFDWLTDYEPADAHRTDAVVDERRVVEEDGDRVVLEGEITVLGRSSPGRAVVELDPPNRWEARVVEGGARPAGSRFVYELEEAGEGASRLEVTYNIRVVGLVNRVKFWLAEDAVREELEEMWDGFVEAMREELVAAAPEAGG